MNLSATTKFVLHIAISSRMPSNCDSVAQELLTTIAGICANAPHLAEEFLPDALQPLYYLGIEDVSGIQAYLKWLISCQSPYLGKTSGAGYQFLTDLTTNTDLIASSFKTMYDREGNDWRIDDPYVPQKSATGPVSNGQSSPPSQ